MAFPQLAVGLIVLLGHNLFNFITGNYCIAHRLHGAIHTAIEIIPHSG
jgi:hypothetical protein